MTSNISIEPFRGDIEGLERMALSSWRDEYGIESYPNLYRPDFLRFLFDRIQDKTHLIAGYRGEEIVSFLANLPRRMSFRGKTYRSVYTCLLVTRKELLRKGMASAIVDEALKLNRDYKYDFSLLALEKGHRSTSMVKKLEESGHPVGWVKQFSVVARVLDLKRVFASEELKAWERAALRLIRVHRPPKAESRSQLREYRGEDINACLTLLNQYKDKVELARVWDREELAWELDYPGVSQTLVYEREGRIEGLINFITHDHHGKTRERWAWINHVAYPELSPGERYEFIQAFLRYIKDAGCIGAVEWTRGYYPMAPLFRSRFFPYFRAVNLVSWTFNPELSIQKIPAVYEVQI